MPAVVAHSPAWGGGGPPAVVSGANRGVPGPRTAVLPIDNAQPVADVAAPFAPSRQGVDPGGLSELVLVEIRVQVAQNLGGHPHHVEAQGVSLIPCELLYAVT